MFTQDLLVKLLSPRALAYLKRLTPVEGQEVVEKVIRRGDAVMVYETGKRPIRTTRMGWSAVQRPGSNERCWTRRVGHAKRLVAVSEGASKLAGINAVQKVRKAA